MNTARCVLLLAPVLAAVCVAQDFGRGMHQHFLMSDYINLNHGAFGSVCRPSWEAERQFYLDMEQDCNAWFRGGYQTTLANVRARLAKYVNARAEDLVLVENASSGVNAVLRSLAEALPLRAGDKILHMNIAYPMVKNVINYLAKYRQLEVVNVTIKFPVHSDEDFIQPVKDAIAAHGPGFRIASFDHIASYPSVILPIKKLVQLCHEHGMLVLVDGAHALGSIPVNITDIGADFYIANAHKWMYSPKGSALLWVRGDKKLQEMIVPTVISSEFHVAPEIFSERWVYTGTRNNGAFLAIGAAMDFRERLGDERIMSYIHNLAWTAGQQVAAFWGTGFVAPVEAMNPAIVCVILPTTNYTKASLAQQKLFAEYNTYTQMGQVVDTDICYMRFSGQIYLEVSDFLLMAQRFSEILKRV